MSRIGIEIELGANTFPLDHTKFIKFTVTNFGRVCGVGT